jgi:sporulation protein YlmC with PRC-barrel domain
MKQLIRTFRPIYTLVTQELHMKNLHSLTFYALITPVITLSASSLFAQAAAGQDPDRQQQGAPNSQTQQREQNTQQGAAQPSPGITQGQQGARAAGQPGSPAVAERLNANESARSKSSGYIVSAPANGMHASKIIGAGVTNSADEDIGNVSELIIDEDGQIVAIVVGVGGFLGMGQRDVAIGWDDVSKSSSDKDELELHVNLTRESLGAAPEFKALD